MADAMIRMDSSSLVIDKAGCLFGKEIRALEANF